MVSLKVCGWGWQSGWCSGYSSRFTPMHPGFNSRHGLYVQNGIPNPWSLSQVFSGFSGFLLPSKLGRVWNIQKHPLTQGEWGAAVLKSGCYNLSADRQSRLHGSTPKWSDMILINHQWPLNNSALIFQEKRYIKTKLLFIYYGRATIWIT